MVFAVPALRRVLPLAQSRQMKTSRSRSGMKGGITWKSRINCKPWA